MEGTSAKRRNLKSLTSRCILISEWKSGRESLIADLLIIKYVIVKIGSVVGIV